MHGASANSNESDIELCSSDEVAVPEEEPELATNTLWRAAMKRARKAAKMTQDQLAAKLGCTQTMLSKLENKPASSKLVRPICRILNIELPEHFVNPRDEEHMGMWRELQAKNPDVAKSIDDLMRGALGRPAPSKPRP